MNWKKTKIQSLVTSCLWRRISVSGEQVEAVTTFIYLGTSIIRVAATLKSAAGLIWPALPCGISTAYGGPVWHFKRRCDSTSSASDPLPTVAQAELITVVPPLSIVAVAWDWLSTYPCVDIKEQRTPLGRTFTRLCGGTTPC